MNADELIKQELEFAADEIQVKFKNDSVGDIDLIRLGAKCLGTVQHEDRFYIKNDSVIDNADELIRIRKEGNDQLLFTFKGPVAKKKSRNRLVIHKRILMTELRDITSGHREVIKVNKQRTLYMLDSVRISLDKIDHLGSFIEFEVRKARDEYLIDSIIDLLKLKRRRAIHLSYFELSLMNLKSFQRMLMKMHDIFGDLNFGISSAVMTTLGVIMSLRFATDSVSAIMSGIATIAFADSLSDAMGIYTSKMSEATPNKKYAFRLAVTSFWSKAIFALSFIIPFLVMPISLAVYTSLVWGATLLLFVNIQIAFIQEENILLGVGRNMLIAAIIVFFSLLLGKIVGGH